jgi:hypothetical protein
LTSPIEALSPLRLTLTAARAAAAAELLGARLVIPAHVDGWAHFTRASTNSSKHSTRAGISNLLQVAAHGEWIDC